MKNLRQNNYTEWYQEVITGADMAENSPVRGCMIIKPWGNGIWERIKFLLDQQIQETGHENCYFPLFVPLSFFLKEAEHVEGFAKEMAMVTHTRLKIEDGKAVLQGELEEPLVVRPTSETIIADAFARWIQSYRDLPVLVNQWANVVRWELRPRMFLRTTEFLWQEGHTAHETREEAVVETMKMLEVYKKIAEECLAMPVITGEKTEGERFPGAENTYCIEAMMQDGKALQAGTSHFLGQSFAKSANIQYQNREGQLEHVYTTSWGVSTRLIGGVIMTHSDDEGLRLPPAIAPSQIVLVPILRDDADKETVLPYAEKLKKALETQTVFGEKVRVKLDLRDRKAQDKRWEWIRKGAPIVCEIGPRDMEKNSVMFVERLDIKAKQFEDVEAFALGISVRLENIQKGLFDQALSYQKEHTRNDIKDFDGFKAYFKKKAAFLPAGGPGFIRAGWCGTAESETLLVDMGVTIRCIPFDQPKEQGLCVITGQPAVKEVIFGRSY